MDVAAADWCEAGFSVGGEGVFVVVSCRACGGANDGSGQGVGVDGAVPGGGNAAGRFGIG